jgi:threonylcarbamoyladenosine tRNA methylthiotransferase MtaB
VHLGSWGRDLTPKRSLQDLVQTILDQTGIARLRLSSLEPWDLDEHFFSLWQDPRLCRHLHLPIQSGSDQILRRMGRRTNKDELRTLIEAAHRHIPDLAITTDLIAGFPGESERFFQESLRFIQSLYLAGGHVFPFSERPGTPAARMDGHVPQHVRKERARLLRASLRESSLTFRSRLLGSRQTVLWEAIAGVSPEGFEQRGWTDNYIRIQSFSPRDLSNQISPVKLSSFTADHSMVSGELLD